MKRLFPFTKGPMFLTKPFLSGLGIYIQSTSNPLGKAQQGKSRGAVGSEEPPSAYQSPCFSRPGSDWALERRSEEY